MQDKDYSKKLYTTNEYLKKNPHLFEIDIPFKVNKIIPLVEEFISVNSEKKVNLLDVGGGTGLIVKRVSKYFTDKRIFIKKYFLDLSPAILEIQKKNNPDFKKALNEDIEHTSLNDNEIDLTLMIDVLEHVENPEKALIELNRISKYVIFKVPLEHNLAIILIDFFKRGKLKKDLEKSGHINIYSFNKLKNQIETYYGEILNYYYADIFSEIIKRGRLSSGKEINLQKKILYYLSI